MPATQDTVQIGSIELDSARGAVRFQPADEFIFVASGEITLTQGAARHRLSAGDSAVLQHGCSFDWSDEVRSTLIFMRYLASQVGTKQVLPIDRSEPSGHSNGPPKELLTSPTPTCWSNTAHTSSDKAFSCGIWISTPFQRRPMFYRYYELMHIVTGSVTFEDGVGRRETFAAGDVFVVEQAANCSWQSHVDVQKVFAVCTP
ncbi:hypothetical protein APR50_27385 [Variovorax paradoxus]|nr:hypothetical protein APR50_27385 [Variovorax paradoxus]KPV29096.1 hypothetical protein APR48_23575 [Variovorax paradoxus]